MGSEELIELLTAAFERAAERLRAQGHENPWRAFATGARARGGA
jgi:hypothetical protein